MSAHALVRRIHLWIGAWGALAAIAFGITGLIQNHRALLPLPQGGNRELASFELPVPEAARATPEALRDWLRAEHAIPLADNVRAQKVPPVELDGRRIEQPARWSFAGGGARVAWNAEYRAGAATVQLRQAEHSALATLLRLHKGVGGGAAWILLSDSFALALTALGISGLVLWSRGRGVRRSVLSVVALALLALVGFGFAVL